LIVTFDFETESHNKGNPFDPRNTAILFAYKLGDNPAQTIEYPTKESVQEIINKAKFLVGFNLKFDLHWLRSIGVVVSDDVLLLDGQQAEFFISNQTKPYPSLEECSQKYLGESKLDVVKTEYWDKGLMTSDVPMDVLTDYAKQDVELTLKVVQRQLHILKTENKLKLFHILMQDLKVLQEMEWNGLRFDEQEAQRLSKLAKAEIKEIDNELFGNHPYGSFINPNSGDHLSVWLYGGTIIKTERVPNGVFKSGKRIGEPRYKNVDYALKFEKQFDPPAGSELQKPGYYSTDEKVLRKLKGRGAAGLVSKLLRRSELDKLVTTYYDGLISTRTKFGWEPDHLHGQLNTVVARTGRLSASEPNQQNMAGNIKELFYSRYG
jgi:DNA polymerase I-like protein with 3'-5' exonuclease and polymerase domains